MFDYGKGVEFCLEFLGILLVRHPLVLRAVCQTARVQVLTGLFGPILQCSQRAYGSMLPKGGACETL